MAQLVDFDKQWEGEGERVTASTHRKIELQSPADLTYLISNLTTLAREKLDKEIPPPKPSSSPNASSDANPEHKTEELRTRITRILDEYIHTTFTHAKPSITINGLDATSTSGLEAEEELEAFDSKLAQRVQNLSAQIEARTLELASLRRKAPKETAEEFVRAFAGQDRELEARVERMREVRMREAMAARVELGQVERGDEIEASLQSGRQSLRVLREGMPAAIEKLEKAQKAVEVVEEK